MIARYSAVLLITLVLYGVSCAPGAVWQDSGLIQYRVWHNDIEGRAGLALAHPSRSVLSQVPKPLRPVQGFRKFGRSQSMQRAKGGFW